MKSRYCLQVKINSSMEEKTEKGQQIGQLPKRDVLTGNEQFPFQEDRENGSITPNALKSFISSGKGGYMSYITEYNVSIHHPSFGIDGSNRYTLEGAIVQVPEDIRMVGLKVSFLNNSGLVETWEFAGGVFENIENWKSNKDKLTDIRDEAIDKIKDAESDAISNFSSQRVTPDMLSESTKQFINASGGGTINNLADDEDLVSVDKGENLSVLKFADRAYNPGIHVGMGYKILRRNIIDGKNILTQDMVNQPHTIYMIQYDFDLDGATITLPEGCMFDFQGGSISNGFLEGKIENTHARPEWFHSPKDGDWSAAIQQALNICPTVKLSDKIYNISRKIVLNIYNSLIGCGHARSIILSQIDDGYAIYCNLDDDFNPLSTPYATMQIKDLDIRYKYSGWQETEYLEYYPNAHAIVSDGYINIENVFISHFNKIIVFPVYADNVRLYNIRADDRARLKNPQYDAHKDFNVKWESNGDNTVIDNCYNMNFYFSNNPNITFRNGIQCGVYLYYANAFVFGLHNEDTVHYKIKLQDSTSTFIKCYFHRNPLNVDEKSIFTFKGESSSNFLIIQDCVFNNHGYVKEQVYIQEPTCIYVEKKNADVRIINSYVSVSSNHGDIYYKQNVFIKEKGTIYEVPSMNGRYYNGIVCASSITNKLSYYFYENNISLIPAKRIYFTYNNTLRIGDYKYELYEVLDKARKIITKRSHSYSINRLENDKVIQLNLFSTTYSNSTAMLRRTFNSDERHKIYLPLLACGTAILIDDGETIVGNPTKWEIDDEDEKYNIIDEQSPVGFVYQNNGMNVTALLKEIPTEGHWIAGDYAYVKGHKYQYDGTNWLDKNGIIANTRKQGNSENRPTNVPAGFYYFDTSLNKPVWKKNDDTNEWVDATGSSV
nr:MAG TPA: tailspike protein [Bacteriophage sp.]